MRAFHRAEEPDVIAPDGIEIRDLINTPRGVKNLSVAEGLLKPLQRSQKGYHTVYEEIWYFLQGSGIFHLHAPGARAEEALPVQPGDTILVSPLHGFWVENTGAGDLIFLLCGSPAWGTGQEWRAWPPEGLPAR